MAIFCINQLCHVSVPREHIALKGLLSEWHLFMASGVQYSIIANSPDMINLWTLIAEST